MKLYPSHEKKKKKLNKRRITPMQIRCDKKCLLYKTHRKFFKIHYLLKYGKKHFKRNKTVIKVF